MKKVVFHTLGCKVNHYETEAMEDMFKNSGYEIVEDEVADIYVINTCTVTNMSDRKSRQFIRRAKRDNKDAVLAVVGCYSQTSPDEIEKIQGVDIILGTSNRDKIVDYCEKALIDNVKIKKVDEIKYKKDFEDISVKEVRDMTRAYIKIQDGCNQFCSYCIIPYARGPIRSRKSSDVLLEIKELAQKGFKEFILTGIHVASYGKDFKDNYKLIDLIDDISRIEGVERIRFSSLEPRLIDDDFMIRLINSKKVCDHFHLSLQSGSDTVLDRMNRKYTSKEYKEKVDIIRKYMPDAGITTDIIVGFPGETEDEFKETLRFSKEIFFSKIHVFKYSKREGTPAANMDGQVNGLIQNSRSEELITLADAMEVKFSEKFIGKTLEVLLEDKQNENDNYMEGYSKNYIRVRVPYREELVGEIVSVNIEGIEGSILLGKLD